MTVLVWVPTKVQPIEELDAIFAAMQPGGVLAVFESPVNGSEEPLRVFARGEWFRAEIDAHDGCEPTIIEPLLP